MWRELGASWYYFGWEPKVVVGLLVAQDAPAVPDPFEVRTARVETLPIPAGSALQVLSAQIPEDLTSWPSLSE